MLKRILCYSVGKKVPPFWIFILPIAIFLVFGFPLVTKYPVPIAVLLIALFITFVLILLCCLYVGLKTDHYVQKHDFRLWKKSKSHSLKERMEAAKEIKALSMQVPDLERCSYYTNGIAFVLLTIWTIIFLLILSFIIFTGV
jgi:hypothetical protein